MFVALTAPKFVSAQVEISPVGFAAVAEHLFFRCAQAITHKPGKSFVGTHQSVVDEINRQARVLNISNKTEQIGMLRIELVVKLKRRIHRLWFERAYHDEVENGQVNPGMIVSPDYYGPGMPLIINIGFRRFLSRIVSADLLDSESVPETFIGSPNEIRELFKKLGFNKRRADAYLRIKSYSDY